MSDEFFFVSQIAKMLFYIFQKREQFTDSALGLNETKRDFFKLRQEFMDTVNFFHSAISLTLDTVCIKNRSSR